MSTRKTMLRFGLRPVMFGSRTLPGVTEMAAALEKAEEELTKLTEDFTTILSDFGLAEKHSDK